jgi:hypothetical protein
MVRSGILGGLDRSNFRLEFGSSVLVGHSECQMAHSGRLGHGTGWGHPKSHIGFCHSSTSVSSKIGHGTGMGTCTSIRSGVLRL